MEFIKPDTHFDFVGKRTYAFGLSALMIVATIISLIAHGGPRYGIDFAGGTLIQVKFSSAPPINTIKAGLADLGLSRSTVQLFGEPQDNEFLIHTDISETAAQDFSEKIQSALSAKTGADVEIRRVEMVGPQVGKDLREKALMAMFFTLLFITIYISGRFEFKWVVSGVMAAGLIAAVYFFQVMQVSIPFLIGIALLVALALFWLLQLRYAMGAIVALIHDVTITVGMFSLFNKEFTLPIIAALLTIIGYSLNDTIIVFDRIRENLRKNPRSPFGQILNSSVNETLSRTILTSGTTLLVVVALLILGGGIIHDFAFALLVGIIVGTYSSIYVASPILLLWPQRGRK